MALTDKLSAIGDAIRSKSGTTDLMLLDDMPAAIEAIQTGGGECSGMHIPEEALTITGDCSNKFSNNGWLWFLEEVGDKLTIKDISNANSMFKGSSKLQEVPFSLDFKQGGGVCTSMFYGCSSLQKVPAINFNQTSSWACDGLFQNCSKLKEIGTLSNMSPSTTGSMFYGCLNLRYLPNFENFNNKMDSSYSNGSSMFHNCYSLRSIPEEWLKKLCTPKLTSYIYAIFLTAFGYCYTLDEVRGLNPQTGAITSNMFGTGTFNSCYRLKDIIFATQEDGTPYSVNWKNQTIDLTGIGYPTGVESIASPEQVTEKSPVIKNIIGYNSGITFDKRVYNDETYQALKNDPDWFTYLGNELSTPYSRYNHDSAVNTINSLPITTNTGCSIKFKGAAGSATDGGAISNLTEEEIAVATAKGWTVTLV